MGLATGCLAVVSGTLKEVVHHCGVLATLPSHPGLDKYWGAAVRCAQSWGYTVGLPVSSQHNITPQLPRALETKSEASA